MSSFHLVRSEELSSASLLICSGGFRFTSNIEPSDGAAKTLPVMNSDDIVPSSRTGPSGELGSTLRSTVSGKFDGKSHFVASGDVVLMSDLRVSSDLTESTAPASSESVYKSDPLSDSTDMAITVFLSTSGQLTISCLLFSWAKLWATESLIDSGSFGVSKLFSSGVVGVTESLSVTVPVGFTKLLMGSVEASESEPLSLSANAGGTLPFESSANPDLSDELRESGDDRVCSGRISFDGGDWADG
jgi:hypothetical protein